MRFVITLIVVCLTPIGAPHAQDAPGFALTPDIRAALDHIRPASLRGDLSFISSDLLEGRYTPSRGLDLAAEYIAAQFRRAGLEAPVAEGYFQAAQMAVSETNLEGFELKLAEGGKQLSVPSADVVVNSLTALEFESLPVFKTDTSDSALVEGLTAAQLNGKVVWLKVDRGGEAGARTLMGKLRDAKPAVLLILARNGAPGRGSRPGQLLDPAEPRSGTPRITVGGESAARFYDALKPGASDARASIHLAAPRETPVSPRNVIGILRGSDPVLRDTYVLVTAHYDHLGMRAEGSGDRIYNGANDDGSGTVSVIELARALASLSTPPRRSIVFMTFFGEEEGLVGSHYYARHPVIPIEKTVAQLNLEQLGRTDSSEGAQISNAALTGFGYSTLTSTVVEAGERTGVHVYKHPRNSDQFFAASDNLSLAEAGVPAHTIGVTFQFPDYHGVGDEWPKIDYDNMAKVDRMVAVALLMVANSAEAPRWDESNPRTEPFAKAWKDRRAR